MNSFTQVWARDRQVSPGATCVQSTWVAVKDPDWGRVRLPCNTSLPWCDGMWICNSFHCL